MTTKKELSKYTKTQLIEKLEELHKEKAARDQKLMSAMSDNVDTQGKYRELATRLGSALEQNSILLDKLQEYKRMVEGKEHQIAWLKEYEEQLSSNRASIMDELADSVTFFDNHFGEQPQYLYIFRRLLTSYEEE